MLEFASSLEHIRSLECLKLHLNHDEVLLDLSVVRESTHWVNGLVSNVIPVGFGRHQLNNFHFNHFMTVLIIFRKSE